jgi:hypothetical protein
MNLNKCISPAVLLLTTVLLAGCSPGTDKGGEVKIVSITPSAGSERIVGEKVEIVAVIEYSLAGTSGKVDLIVETADGKSVGTGSAPEIVDRSGEIVTLRRTIIVPETTALRVFAVMRSGSSSDSPGSVDAIRYSVVPNVPVPDEWDAANARVRRLSPHVFAELPAALKDELAKRQCTVPQTYISTRPHNVIQGEFAKKGQKDWAVVCSTGHMSSILVFFGGSDKDVFQFAAGSDKNYLQGIGGGKIGYSQLIGVVGEDYILEHYKRYGGPTPPPITHDGINVAFVEKASSVLYLEKGEWLSLTGAD